MTYRTHCAGRRRMVENRFERDVVCLLRYFEGSYVRGTIEIEGETMTMTGWTVEAFSPLEIRDFLEEVRSITIRNVNLVDCFFTGESSIEIQGGEIEL